jgi:hypothetical protein
MFLDPTEIPSSTKSELVFFVNRNSSHPGPKEGNQVLLRRAK